ncbi:MAG: site-2 protease family protein, partial [Vicinamibacteria bacterium]|nr:site-2 protease family protein [Vicinamibacteria bacterium]
MFGIIATIGDKLSAGFHTLWATIIVLGIIIFVHEFGHFLSAKFFGMRVWIFSFGFGKRLWGFKRGDTDYRISLIPLGGYVKLEGEPEDFLSENTTKQGDTQDFLTRPRWQRFIMYFAGPLMNAVLTVGILTVAYMIGFPESSEKHSRPILGAVDPGLPAAQAGLRAGDEILTIDGQKISRWEELLYRVMISPEHALHLTIRRAGAEQTIDV